MIVQKLTTKNYWQNAWTSKSSGFFDPDGVVKWIPNNLKLIWLFKKYLSKRQPTKKIIELGGASGKWLTFFGRDMGYELYSVDYSKVGNAITERTIKKFGLKCQTILSDIFNKNFQTKYKDYFDVTFSAGLIEHFGTDDIERVVGAHANITKPGGKIIIIFPNFSKSSLIYKISAKLGQNLNDDHNIEMMSGNFKRLFENIEDTKLIHAGYYGPVNIAAVSYSFEHFRNLKFAVIHVINAILGYFTMLVDSRWTSGQIVVVLEKEKRQ